jgi:hypothetical protein
MKFLIASVLASVLGLGWFGYSMDASADGCRATDCDVSVECLPDGTCRIECEGPDGASCWIELDCDAEGECSVIDSGGDCCLPLEECPAVPACVSAPAPAGSSAPEGACDAAAPASASACCRPGD